MEEIESKNSGEIPQVVEDFDLNYERFLEFDEPYKDSKSIKQYLGSWIDKKDLPDWAKIAVTCRWMIICDRELDLEKGAELMKDTRKRFEELKREMFEDTHEGYHKDQLLYEAIRYANTCGLISYRCGDFSSALDHFRDAENMAMANPSMCAFVPDLTSNVIRTRFESFGHTLPSRGIRPEDIEDIEYYEL